MFLDYISYSSVGLHTSRYRTGPIFGKEFYFHRSQEIKREFVGCSPTSRSVRYRSSRKRKNVHLTSHGGVRLIHLLHSPSIVTRTGPWLEALQSVHRAKVLSAAGSLWRRHFCFRLHFFRGFLLLLVLSFVSSPHCVLQCPGLAEKVAVDVFWAFSRTFFSFFADFPDFIEHICSWCLKQQSFP